jgi:hypothetical protein
MEVRITVCHREEMVDVHYEVEHWNNCQTSFVEEQSIPIRLALVVLRKGDYIL